MTQKRCTKKTEVSATALPEMIEQIKVVRVGRRYRGPIITEAADVYEFWKNVISRKGWFDAERETSIVLLVDSKCRVSSWNLISVGTGKVCIMDSTGVFRSAIATASLNVIVLHNHPSGDCSPSKRDLRLTRCLAMAGQLLGIPLLDHLVVSHKGFLSIRNEHSALFESDEHPLDRGIARELAKGW